MNKQAIPSRAVSKIMGGVLIEGTESAPGMTYEIVHAELSSAATWNRQDAPVLVRTPGGPIQVTLHHGDLGNLIGKLMQMADLMGDTAQREAVKRTIKRESRDWLDSIYQEAGYKEAGYDGSTPLSK